MELHIGHLRLKREHLAGHVVLGVCRRQQHPGHHHNFPGPARHVLSHRLVDGRPCKLQKPVGHLPPRSPAPQTIDQRLELLDALRVSAPVTGHHNSVIR